ncbi:RagB/SusD family nutrient uptake outer membrane protein [Pedobacter boryungensis]|uniref:RagB/SusD family nutrient uptake outer membrane protein n=1 Tax=Pedobacter boryungensis TaxID=869962 RepID=A0ABX2DEK6_9SPHI|nr:RagB/SusD family nutrient uptake outer membrane protein [Pedobacter boryungensis]NQX32522.1 RagB/SusD family nutrient uptake outer membrane protein [Pedobacter boryungensis]
MKIFDKKTRNFIFTIAVFVIAIMASGCKKFLDTQKQGSYSTETYPFANGAGDNPYDQYVFGAYNELRSYNVHVDGFLVATSIRSDDADKGSTPTDGGADVIGMDNFSIVPTNGRCNALWTGYYNMISKANLVLDQVENNKDIIATDGAKIQAQAEAKFIRGYAYFMLVRLFGRVPLVDKVVGASDSNIPQSTPAQIYTFIEADLQFAAANLPASWPSKFVGRLTKGAANGMLAKVYLTQQKWGMAMASANAVMTSGQYDLSTSYDKVFREEGENSKESVFEVQATASAAVPTANGIQLTSHQGIRGSGIWDLGWGWNTPSVQLEAAYETNDPRRERTILYTSTAGNPRQTIYGETLPVGLPNPRYNNKVYTNPAIRASVGHRFGYWMNVRILRYADVVLMYAEAANELGGATNTTAALTALNSVRERARRGAPAGTLPDITVTDQTALRTIIQHERRIELAMEYDRFFDLIRWGATTAQAAMSAAGKTAFSFDRDKYLPIPLTQIDLSKNVLTQNFGYN